MRKCADFTRWNQARLIRAPQIYMERQILKLAPFMSLSSAESRELIRLISGANRRLELVMEAHLKPNGMAIEQYRVLEALERRDTELAERLVREHSLNLAAHVEKYCDFLD